MQIQQVTPDLAAALGIAQDGPQGALVVAVTNDGPAAKAGIKVGDVIQQLNGKPVAKTRDLPRMVAATAAGKTVHLAVLREGKPIEVDATVGQLEDKRVATADGDDAAPTSGAPKLGLALAELNPELRSRLHIGPEAGCAVITHVKPGSLADNAGLEGGDVIERINGQHVDSPDNANTLFATAEKAPGKPILLLIDRHGSESFKALSQTTGEG